MKPLYNTIMNSLGKNDLINICNLSQQNLYNILVSKLELMNYKVFACDQSSNCSRYIYAVGDTPICLTAHLDTVFGFDPHKDIQIDGDILSCKTGMGADDRVGVYMILEIIKELKCNILFLEDEECGHSGAVHFIASPYKERFQQENNFCIDLDMAGSNILTFYETTNNEFQKDVSSILPQYKVRNPKLGASDLIELTIGWEKEGRNGVQKYEGTNVASLNIGVGYYKEHTFDEYVKFNEVLRCIDDVKKLIKNMPQKTYKAK